MHYGPSIFVTVRPSHKVHIINSSCVFRNNSIFNISVGWATEQTALLEFF
jgi:hypothetical protein